MYFNFYSFLLFCFKGNIFLSIVLQCWLNVWFSSREPKSSSHFHVSDSKSLLNLLPEINLWLHVSPQLLCFMLTLQSRCSRLWSEAHFFWSSESSSTWLSRLKCSRASFSCISRTCSSCSKEQTLPKKQTKTDVTFYFPAKSDVSPGSFFFLKIASLFFDFILFQATKQLQKQLIFSV